MQVETVGDKYMAVSGLPEPCSSHAKCMAGLALDMMDLVDQIKFEDVDVVCQYFHENEMPIYTYLIRAVTSSFPTRRASTIF
jgi:hypothetical protein